MTATVVGSYADWVGVLACTVALIVAAARMAFAHTCRETEPWEIEAVVLATLGVTVLIVASRLPVGVSIPAAMVVGVGFPGLLVYSARRWARDMREFDRAAAARAADAGAAEAGAAEAAAGLGSASDVRGGW